MTSAVTIEEARCEGCKRCFCICPTDVFRITEAGKAFVAFPTDCHVCFLCVDDCPSSAISLDPSIGHGRHSSIYADYHLNDLVYMPDKK